MTWMEDVDEVKLVNLIRRGATNKARLHKQQAAIRYLVKEARLRGINVKKAGAFLNLGDYFVYGSKYRRRGSKEYQDLNPLYLVGILDNDCPLRQSLFNVIKSASQTVPRSEVLQLAHDMFDYIKKHGCVDRTVMRGALLAANGGLVHRKAFNKILAWCKENDVIYYDKGYYVAFKDMKKAHVVWSYILETIL